MFAAALGLLGTGISAAASMANADAQMQIAWEQLALQRRAQNMQQDMALRQWSMAQENFRREKEQEEYIREVNAYNRKTMADEYKLRLNSQRERAGQARTERNYVLDRQLAADKDAARRYAFQLENFLKNKDLATEEREYAKNLLEDQRAIARGERDEDLARFYDERSTAARERDFAIQQMQRAQAIAARERADDASIRDTVVNRAIGMQGALDAALRSLGPAPEVPQVTREMISNETANREALAMADTDRAVTRVASANEADLMRRGMDRSSQAEQKRADITARSALEYARARDAARDSAIRYISGVNNELMEGYNAAMQRRQAVLGETANVAGAGLNTLSQLRSLRSENDYRSPVQIGSAIFTRGVRSANQYQAPVGLGSAIFDRWNGGTTMSDLLPTPSIAQAMELNPGSALAPSQNWGITSPATLASGATSTMANIAAQNGAMANAAFQRGYAQQAGGFQGLQRGLEGLGGAFDMYGRRGPTGPSASPAGAATLYDSPIGPSQPSFPDWMMNVPLPMARPDLSFADFGVSNPSSYGWQGVGY